MKKIILIASCLVLVISGSKTIGAEDVTDSDKPLISSEVTKGKKSGGPLEPVLQDETGSKLEKKPKDFISLVCGASGGCDAFKRNQRAKNTHDSRAIKATFEWRQSGGGAGNISINIEPGATETVTYCNCGAVTVVGARYINR